MTVASLELHALVKSLVQQVRVGDAEISVWLNRIAVVSSVMPDATPRQAECKTAVEPAILSIVATLRRAGKGTRLVIGDGSASKIDGGLASLIARATCHTQHAPILAPTTASRPWRLGSE